MAFAVVIKQLFTPTVLGIAAGTLLTVPTSPSNTTLQNGRVRFTNTTNAIQAVTAYAVPFGGTAAAGNCFLNAESISPNNHIDIDVPVMGAGDFLQALAGNATAITASSLGGTLQSQ